MIRSAERSLRGYLYQFQRSIAKLVRQSGNSIEATFEHIEDLDLLRNSSLQAIQFKYLPSKTLTMSLVRWPILEMLKDDFTSQRNAKYELFIHTEGKPNFSISSRADLKTLAQYKSKKQTMNFLQSEGIPDRALDSFLRRFRITLGMAFEDSKKELIQVLQNHFACTSSDAKDYYYPNAIALCLQLSTNKRPKDRTISKKNFCAMIDKRPYHFARWFVEMKSTEAYIRHLTKRIGPIAKKNSYSRMVIVDSAYGCIPISKFIKKLVDKYYKIPDVLYSVKPWSVIVKGNRNDVDRVKIALIRESISFNDGHESLEFDVPSFEMPPIINTSKTLKVTKASYLVRILSEDTYRNAVLELKQPDAIMCFSPEANINIDYLRGSLNGHIYMASISNIAELERILIL